MSWLNDLTSVAGVPGTAAVVATAIYRACAAAENDASKERLEQIAQALRDPGWLRTEYGVSIVESLFCWTFGDNHLSWKCLRRSGAATLIFCFSLGIYYGFHYKTIPFAISHFFLGLILFILVLQFDAFFGLCEILASVTFCVLVFGAFPDYLALWKTRLLLRGSTRVGGIVNILGIAVVDIVLSILISVSVSIAGVETLAWVHDAGTGLGGIAQTIFFDVIGFNRAPAGKWQLLIWMLLYPMNAKDMYGLLSLFILSTLFTSIWIILVLLSLFLIKLLAPLHRFQVWFFNIEQHPVRAVGRMAATLVVIFGAAWALIQVILW